MSTRSTLRPIPVDDRAWLLAGLGDALRGGAPVLPLAPGLPEDEVLRLQETPLPEGTAVVVRTSGSSGVPKAVCLSARALIASAEATHEAFGGPGQWLVTLPGHLISGLQLLVRSEVSGIPPTFFDAHSGSAGLSAQPSDSPASRAASDSADSADSAEAALIAAADRMQHERRFVSLVPVQLARLLDYAERNPEAADTLRGFAAVLVGGQATPVSLRQRAHELGVSLRRSYGMTETAGGCVYDGVEIGDTRVRIRQGEVQLAGSSLALGYLGDEDLTAASFVEDLGPAGESVRWYRTGDSGELLGGMLTVTGRIDRVIVSGGVNVSLDEIERVVGELPGWQATIAIGVPDAEWGERPMLVREIGASESAGASPETGTRPATRDGDVADLSFDELRATVRAALGAAATPEWVTETPELPRLASGKPDLPAIERWIADLRASFRTAR